MEKTLEQTVRKSFDQAYNQGIDHSIEILKQYQNNDPNPILGSIIKRIEDLKASDNNVDPIIANALKPFI